MALGSTQPLMKMSIRNIPGGKCGRCMRLTTSSPSRAKCHEIWEPKPPGTLWATLGLLRVSFSPVKRLIKCPTMKTQVTWWSAVTFTIKGFTALCHTGQHYEHIQAWTWLSVLMSYPAMPHFNVCFQCVILTSNLREDLLAFVHMNIKHCCSAYRQFWPCSVCIHKLVKLKSDILWYWNLVLQMVHVFHIS